MKRTISVMVGKGSVKHNSRAFHATNTDPKRSDLNRCYCNEDIREVYQTLFGVAVEQYNKKQTRKDRTIADYYQKICSGKQEKPFYEIILQIGDKDNMSAESENGSLAACVLEEYMQDFQRRNPYLRVFSAHLHMDEATPHLHVDFVPFTTGSTRGLDARVSLKQALARQGFTGGTRQETEWNQWVHSEKQQLALVMARHGIEWEQKGTHEKHLSVLEYEKKMRGQEVAELSAAVQENAQALEQLQAEKETIGGELSELQQRRDKLSLWEAEVESFAREYEQSEAWQLPEPTSLMSAKVYKTKIVEPFIAKLKEVIAKLIAVCFNMKKELKPLQEDLYQQYEANDSLKAQLVQALETNKQLHAETKDFTRVKEVLGEAEVEKILKPETAESAQKNVWRIEVGR